MFVKKIISNLLNKEADLKADPFIVRVNNFTEKAAAQFALEMGHAHNTGQSVIPVVIDSYGGNVYSLMAMISTVQQAQMPVAMIVEGKAMSCGSILSTFGNEGMRFCDPNATFMIHDVAGTGRGKTEEVKMCAKEIERLNEIVHKMMAQNCGKADDYFLKIADKKKHADWYFDAKEAKKHGIVNHIRVPKMTATVEVKIEFE